MLRVPGWMIWGVAGWIWLVPAVLFGHRWMALVCVVCSVVSVGAFLVRQRPDDDPPSDGGGEELSLMTDAEIDAFIEDYRRMNRITR